MSAKGYVVRWTEYDYPADREPGAKGRPASEAAETLPDAMRIWRDCGALADLEIFAVAEDGTETPLPSYEDALAKIEALTEQNDAGWAIAKARLASIERLSADLAAAKEHLAQADRRGDNAARDRDAYKAERDEVYRELEDVREKRTKAVETGAVWLRERDALRAAANAVIDAVKDEPLYEVPVFQALADVLAEQKPPI